MLTTALKRAKTKTTKGTVREFERGDVPVVAELFNRTFRKDSDAATATLEAFFTDVFFDAPCQRDTPLRSYVFEGEDGAVGGFVGCHPRTLMLDGSRITAAAYGQLMVAPELRGQGIAHKLVKRFYEGGQDYTLCGSAAPATRKINDRLGGINPAAYGVTWRRTLRPARVGARRLANARKLGPLRKVAAACCTDLVVHTGIDPCDSLNMSDVETVYERAAAGERFHPVFEPDHLAWKFRTAAASANRATMASVVRATDGPIGWYVWSLSPNGAATVVEMLCVPGHYEAVFRDLFRKAHMVGAESIGGLCRGATESEAAKSVGAAVRLTESTFVFHAQEPQLLQAYPDGPQPLSIFDGEGWIDFPH